MDNMMVSVFGNQNILLGNSYISQMEDYGESSSAIVILAYTKQCQNNVKDVYAIKTQNTYLRYERNI